MKRNTQHILTFVVIVAAVFLSLTFIMSGSAFAAIVAPNVGIAHPAIAAPNLGVAHPAIVNPAVPLAGLGAQRAVIAPRPAAPSDQIGIGEPFFNPFFGGFNPFFGGFNPFFGGFNPFFFGGFNVD